MAKAKKKKAPRHPLHLSADDWVQAGLRTLARHGVSSVRVEQLARDLKVTKGSFYWHFTDREALLDAMLTAWRGRSNAACEQVIERFPDQPREQLQALLRVPEATAEAVEGSEIELALRLWARRDQHVGEMLREMHQHRHRTLSGILSHCGIDPARLPGLILVLSSMMLNRGVADGRSATDRETVCGMMMEIVDHYCR